VVAPHTLGLGSAVPPCCCDCACRACACAPVLCFVCVCELSVVCDHILLLYMDNMCYIFIYFMLYLYIHIHIRFFFRLLFFLLLAAGGLTLTALRFACIYCAATHLQLTAPKPSGCVLRHFVLRDTTRGCCPSSVWWGVVVGTCGLLSFSFSSPSLPCPCRGFVRPFIVRLLDD